MKHGKKRISAKKVAPRKLKSHDERPFEFDRAWQDLEDQNARLQMDWAGLAAQMGIMPGEKAF